MSEAPDQIERLLRSLAQNSDLIAEAFHGEVELGDRHRNQRIDTLSTMKAFKPLEEDVYRLNPRLRDFIADYLVSYRAFQTLTRLAGLIHQARSLWREMREAKSIGDEVVWDQLYFSFDDVVAEISYSIERNLALLHTLVSTQYGDVGNFGAKLRQNKYYINEISEALNEMAQVDSLFSQIEADSVVAGLPQVRSIVRSRLLRRLLLWTSQIKDAQATINRSLFKARRLEERVRKLSRVARWLRQNKTSIGFDVALANAPQALFIADPIRVKTHIDVRSPSSTDQAVLLDAMKRMPPRIVPRPAVERAAPLALLEEGAETAIVVEQMEPHDVMIEALVVELRQTLDVIALRQWKANKAELEYLTDEEWLLYASIQLRIEGMSLTFVAASDVSIQTTNEVSDDILARAA